MGKPRPRSELVALLAEQRQALAVSCESFDKGNGWEAARLATSVFTLVHDGGSILSLLTQLGLRAPLRFVSTGQVKDKPGLVAASPPLLQIELNSNTGVRFRPRFGSFPNEMTRLQFPRWWEKEVIFKGGGSTSLTRRRLVFSLRHQDGGGHVGSLTDKAYVAFKAGGGWFGGAGDGPPKPLDMGATTTMRQVAWEMTETLKQIGEAI